MKIPNLEQYVAIFPKGTSTGPVPKRVRKIPGTGRTIAVTSASALAALLKMLKFLVKVFKSLYLPNLWMDLVGTLPNVSYWSEVLCCTITTHIGDLDVKNFEILS